MHLFFVPVVWNRIRHRISYAVEYITFLLSNNRYKNKCTDQVYIKVIDCRIWGRMDKMTMNRSLSKKRLLSYYLKIKQFYTCFAKSLYSSITKIWVFSLYIQIPLPVSVKNTEYKHIMYISSGQNIFTDSAPK